MASLQFEEQKIDVQDNSNIISASEELGVYFGCQDGNCGVCEIEIVEGFENLNALTSAEMEFNMLKNHRLACQCKISKGNVKIKL